jgi:hypothetical protein
MQQYALLGRTRPNTHNLLLCYPSRMLWFEASRALALITCRCALSLLLQKRTSDQALTTANEELAHVKQE